jgi:hypothetical protein
MNAREFIRMSLEAGKGWITTLLRDMEDAPLTMPTSKGGNHPLWILGHVAYSEAELFDVFVRGKTNRFEKWKHLFAAGTTPVPEADRYPKMGELFAAFDAVRADTLAHLAAVSDGDLEKPSRAPQEFGPTLATIAGCYLAMIVHVAFHEGQVADARRAAGRKPLMM